MTQKAIQLHIGDQQKVVSRQIQLPALQEDDVRIRVLYSNISKNDLLQLEGKNKNDYFGTQVVGKVVEVGKNVGHCKKDQIVGVFYENINKGDPNSGFSDYVQVSQYRVVYIPQTIQPEQAAVLMGSGTIAFNALQHVQPGSEIAVVGRNHLAYIVTQYAKKVHNCDVTTFSYQGDKQLATSMGANDYMPVCKQWIEKRTEKYKAVIITQELREDDAGQIQQLAWRNGNIIFAINMGFDPKMFALAFICGQKRFIGVKRGQYGQAVKAIKAAAYNNIRGKVKVYQASKYQDAFKYANESNAEQSIALKY